jgi:hypothetical protein
MTKKYVVPFCNPVAVKLVVVLGSVERGAP